MTLSYDVAQRLYRSGEFGTLSKPFEAAHPNDSRLDPEVRVLVAHGLVRVGHPDRARELLSHEIAANASIGLRARAQVVLGLACRSTGQFADAQVHLRSAVRLAQEQGEPEAVAWTHLHLLRHMLDSGEAEIAQAMVPIARRSVSRAGSAQATAYLHAVIAAMEGQKGHLDEGWRHCEIATSILTLAPNAWLTCSVLRSQASIAVSQCRTLDALELIRSLRAVAERYSLTRDIVENEVNLGYIQLWQGDYLRSSRTLARVIESPSTSMRVRLASLETLARVCLASNQLTLCRSHLDRINTLALTDANLLHTSAVRWARLVRARLSMKEGDSEVAVREVRSADPEAFASSDAPFSATAHLTLAQALSRLSEKAAAATHLIRALGRGGTRFRDVQGQYYFAAGTVVEGTNSSLSRQLKSRARRLWAHQGIASLEREMEDMPPSRAPRARKPGPATAINALGSAIDLAHSPRLLAQELVQILEDINIKSTVVNEAPQEHSGEHVSLALGSDLGQPVTIMCETPQTPEQAVLMQDILRVARAAVELDRYREDERRRTALWPEDPIEEQLGALFISEEMRELLATVRRIAATTVPILITGETGTGKEVVARLVHAYSQRARAPFLAFNCTSTPRDMLDSQLFGHRRGAFTGAVEHFPGIVRTADRGTLLLDEIGDMPLDVQPKLLRFLESGEVHPIGESRPTKVDVRVLAATNTRLDSLVSEGQFREDLYYRLNIVELAIPPLRERRVDIPSLANHYLKKHAHEYSKGELRLGEDTMEYLLLYKWPGNVRQLANEMRRLAAVAETGEVLMPEHLSRDIAASRRTVPVAERPADPRELVVRVDQPLAAAVEHVERTMIQLALEKCNGRVEETAALLGLSRKGLYLKRQRYQLDQPGPAVRLQA
jgi:DNA-binding NtrC family response regulator